jgi:hypothetical protein
MMEDDYNPFEPPETPEQQSRRVGQMIRDNVDKRRWRVGRTVPINVYEGNRPVCQCHTADDARRIVTAMNREIGLTGPAGCL